MKNKLLYLVKANLGRYILGAIVSFIGGIMSWDGLIGQAIRNWDNFNPYQWSDPWWVTMIVGICIVLGQFLYHVGYAIVSAIKRALK